ncbi:MAG TPA: MarR family transcriptional regulator [Microlunatus sp.]|nr:MarR family transcriptional regulator [Microlunatus sp.]
MTRTTPRGSGPIGSAIERSDAVVLADNVRMVSRATVSATRAAKGLPTLPEAQVSVLRTLRASPALTPAELAQRLDLARPTVSNLLRDLDTAGYLVRKPSEVDRRSITLTITEQARDVQDAFQRGRVEVVTAAWAALTDSDRAALIAATPALRRLADLLHGHTHPAGQEARP